MPQSVTVAEVVARFLEGTGIATVFGVISIHNMPMLDCLHRRNSVRFVSTRGEAGAAHMADAYARVGGGLGVVVTSTGPGAANAAGGLLEAAVAGSPVLHLTGQTELRYIGSGAGTIHDAPDQLAMLASVSKRAYRIATPASALPTLMRAAAEALTPPRGPVSIEIPVDVQRATVAVPDALERIILPVPPPLPPDAAALETLVAMVAESRRVMLWLGNGARHAGAEAGRLADLGIGIVTSMHGRGVLPEDHPMTLGAFNGNFAPPVEKFYDSVDLMIVAGSRLRGHETRDFRVALPKRRCRIDVDPLAAGHGYDCELFVAGDSALTLADLASRLDGRFRPDPAFAADVARARRDAENEMRAVLGPYGEMSDRLRASMPRDAVWVRDITLCNSTWGNRLFPVYASGDNVYAINAGIGMGLAFGIGAAFAASGRKVVTLSGDGGFVLNVGELWTAAQEGLDNVILVMNDGGYGVIRNIQDAQYGGRRAGVDLRMPDYARLAASAGIAHARLGRVAEVGPIVTRALARGGPTLIEVDMAAIGPFPNRFVGPPPPGAKR